MELYRVLIVCFVVICYETRAFPNSNPTEPPDETYEKAEVIDEEEGHSKNAGKNTKSSEEKNISIVQFSEEVSQESEEQISIATAPSLPPPPPPQKSNGAHKSTKDEFVEEIEEKDKRCKTFDSGECNSYVERYYYDQNDGECRPGNVCPSYSNDYFESIKDCQKYCVHQL